MSSSMVERVRLAIAGVQLWERLNDWTSDHVPGLPVEICRYGHDGEDEIVVVERHSIYQPNGAALAAAVGSARARAAIQAMRPFILEWADEASSCTGPGDEAVAFFRGQIDAALAPPTSAGQSGEKG